MNPLKSENIVAKILQVYAYVNVVAGVFMAFNIGDETSGYIGVVYFALVLVVSFLIFALGEIIDLLSEIKNNTHKTKTENRESFTSNESKANSVFNDNASQNSFYNKGNNTSATPANAWKCKCGRVNATYVSSCVCGRSKFDRE